MPIIDLSDFGDGKQYPPMREQGRVTDMGKWHRFSNRRFAGLWEGQSTARIKPNLFRFLMEFWQDAIWADSPIIEYDGGGRQQEFIDAVTPSLFEAGRLVVGDMIRYGVGVFTNRKPLEIQSIDPRFWFPVRMPYDESVGDVDVIAYPYSVDQELGGSFDDHIQIEIHSPDMVTTVRRKLEGITIQGVVDRTEQTGSVFQVVPVRNGNGFYGTSDFLDSEEYVAEIQRRESAIGLALDKHVNPHLAVPEGSLVVNTDGSVNINSDGMVIPVPEGGNNPSYLNWEPQYDAQHRSIERAEDRILQASKIASVLFHRIGDELGSLPTGAALRRLAIVSVNRIRQIRTCLDTAMTDTLIGAADLSAKRGNEVISLARESISYKWPAELSSGITDEADAIRALVDSGALTRETALQLVERVSREEAEALAAAFKAMGSTQRVEQTP